MYIFRNAIMNLGRNRGRNVIMGVIIFAIIAATAVYLLIAQTKGINLLMEGRFKYNVLADEELLGKALSNVLSKCY